MPADTPWPAVFHLTNSNLPRAIATPTASKDIGRYYRDYVELMDHFDRVIPGKVHRVFYENMIEDTEAEVRRLLSYCGLAFESACLRFYENDRPVRTASAQQVRQPIYREGVRTLAPL